MFLVTDTSTSLKRALCAVPHVECSFRLVSGNMLDPSKYMQFFKFVKSLLETIKVSHPLNYFKHVLF